MKTKNQKPKAVWKGTFNYKREMIILYTYAFSQTQAREIFFRRLADRHDVEVCRVRQIFDGSTDNFTITVEATFQEVADAGV